MLVNEIFLSIQGESISVGFPTIFVRFTGCNLRCSYCDTAYAYTCGNSMTVMEIVREIKKHDYKRVCLTGGEPLLQEDLNSLLHALGDYTVTIETNGSVLLRSFNLQKNHSYVIDMKTPSSGCSDKMKFENFQYLSQKDEIKFVIAGRNDYDWSKKVIKEFYKNGIITFSPVYKVADNEEMVKWILEDRLDVRFQVQLHKIIWGPNVTGV